MFINEAWSVVKVLAAWILVLGVACFVGSVNGAAGLATRGAGASS